MHAAMAAARSQVWLATYIFHDDSAARTVADALNRAAARGVAVHVVVDGFGSIATITSEEGESEAEFTTAAEVRRLAP